MGFQELLDLEQTSARLAREIRDGLPPSREVGEFRAQFKRAFSQAKRTAEKQTASFLVKRAKGRFACWDLIQRLRRPVQSVAIDACTMSEHFDEVFHDRSEPLFLDLSQLGIFPPSDFRFMPFTDKELVAALGRLNSKASTGPQRVASKYLKHVFLSSQTRVPLLLLFNRCFESGRVPISWGESEVFVLYKGKGYRAHPTNYRFINLNNDFLRLYERLLQARFDSWLAVERPWGPMQFGFSSGVGTEDALHCLRTLALTFTRAHGIPCYANFLDLRKAFPSINRAATLRALADLGVPYELIRAFASTFSLNSGRLLINGGLTGSLIVNKGTKEGGINSPPIFNSAYVTALSKLNILEFPSNGKEVDPDKVYYIVFADDLVLISANLTRLEIETNNLDRELEVLGMKINADKTKWMMFLPVAPIMIPDQLQLRLRLGTQELELVPEFTYLGFTIDSYASLCPHVSRREKLLLTAAKFSGKLMRQLEVTNTRSLRAYFYSLVTSQLYGQAFAAISETIFIRAQKIFLQEAWNLPSSFPLNLATFILNGEDLEMIGLRARIRFLRHLITGNRTKASLSAIIIDRSILMPLRTGWNHDTNVMFPSTRQEMESIDLTDPRAVRLMYARLARRLAEKKRAITASSSHHHMLDLFPTLSIPRAFGDILGQLPFESVRLFVLYIGNMTRFTYLKRRKTICEWCKTEMYAKHFFECKQYEALGDEHVPWSDFVQMFLRNEWWEGVSSVICRMAGWARRSTIFRAGFRDQIDEIYQEMQWLRRDRIRRAGGAVPPALPWSLSS
jgi:hypothetical protein